MTFNSSGLLYMKRIVRSLCLARRRD